MQGPVRAIVKRVLQNLQECRNVVEINLRVDPYSEEYIQLDLLRTKVIENEKKAARLLVDAKIEPSISICSFSPQVVTTLGHLAN